MLKKHFNDVSKDCRLLAIQCVRPLQGAVIEELVRVGRITSWHPTFRFICCCHSVASFSVRSRFSCGNIAVFWNGMGMDAPTFRLSTCGFPGQKGVVVSSTPSSPFCRCESTGNLMGYLFFKHPPHSFFTAFCGALLLALAEHPRNSRDRKFSTAAGHFRIFVLLKNCWKT